MLLGLFPNITFTGKPLTFCQNVRGFKSRELSNYCFNFTKVFFEIFQESKIGINLSSSKIGENKKLNYEKVQFVGSILLRGEGRLTAESFKLPHMNKSDWQQIFRWRFQ